MKSTHPQQLQQQKQRTKKKMYEQMISFRCHFCTALIGTEINLTWNFGLPQFAYTILKTISIRSLCGSHSKITWNFICSNHICEISSASMLVNRARTNFSLYYCYYYYFVCVCVVWKLCHSTDCTSMLVVFWIRLWSPVSYWLRYQWHFPLA